MRFSEFIVSFRKANRLSYRAFAAGLNECLVDPREHMTFSAIYLWALGSSTPYYSRLESIHKNAPADSWQKNFAAQAMPLVLGEQVKQQVT